MNSILEKMNLSDNAKGTIQEALELPKEKAIARIAHFMRSSKFGTATTHMSKLLLRIDRGGGDPCPFILVGIGRETNLLK